MDQERSWWQRNWIWAVSGGCGGCLLLVVLGVGGIAYFTFTLIKSSGAYSEAVAIAAEDPRVIEALGQPIETGLFVGGSVEVTGPSGEAEISIPLSGPKGSGTLYVEARKSADEWQFLTLELEVEGGAERIELLPGGETRSKPQ